MSKYQELVKGGIDDQFRSFVLQLYEKSLISGKTVVEMFGFDPDEEVKRKENDLAKVVPESLGTLKPIVRDTNQVLATKVEHSRRNVEILLRSWPVIRDMGEDVKKKAGSVVEKCLVAMEEAVNIK
jgi:hypothetical protein